MSKSAKPYNKILRIIAFAVLVAFNAQTCLQAAPVEGLRPARDAETKAEAGAAGKEAQPAEGQRQAHASGKNITVPIPPPAWKQRQRGVDYSITGGTAGDTEDDRWMRSAAEESPEGSFYGRQRQALVDAINEGLVDEDFDRQYRAVWLLEKYLKERPNIFTDADLSFFLGASDACCDSVIKEAILRKNTYLLKKAAFGRGLSAIVIKRLDEAMRSTWPEDPWLKQTYEQINRANAIYLGYQHTAYDALKDIKGPADGSDAEEERGETARKIVWLKKALRNSMGVNYRDKCLTRRFVFKGTTIYHIQPPFGGNITVFAYGEGEKRRFTMVDAGIGAYYHELLDYLARPLFTAEGRFLKEAIPPERIERILISHYDTDHASCAAMFHRDYGIHVFCHPSYSSVIDNRVQGSETAKKFTDFAKVFMVMVEPSEGEALTFDTSGRQVMEIGGVEFGIIGSGIEAGALKLIPLQNIGAGTETRGSHTADYTYYAMLDKEGLVGMVAGELLPAHKNAAGQHKTDRDLFLETLVFLNDGLINVNCDTRLLRTEIHAIRTDPRILIALPGHGGPQVRGKDGVFGPLSGQGSSSIPSARPHRPAEMAGKLPIGSEAALAGREKQPDMSQGETASERRTRKQWAYFYDKLYAVSVKVVGEAGMKGYERRFRRIDRIRIKAERAKTEEKSVQAYKKALAELESLVADIQLMESSEFIKGGYYSEAATWLGGIRPKLDRQERRWLLARIGGLFNGLKNWDKTASAALSVLMIDKEMPIEYLCAAMDNCVILAEDGISPNEFHIYALPAAYRVSEDFQAFVKVTKTLREYFFLLAMLDNQKMAPLLNDFGYKVLDKVRYPDSRTDFGGKSEYFRDSDEFMTAVSKWVRGNEIREKATLAAAEAASTDAGYLTDTAEEMPKAAKPDTVTNSCL